MVSWVFVILVVSFVALIWIKLEHPSKHMKYLMGFVLILILLFFGFVIFTSKPLDLSSSAGIVHALGLYFSWLFTIVSVVWKFSSQATGKVIEALGQMG